MNKTEPGIARTVNQQHTNKLRQIRPDMALDIRVQTHHHHHLFRYVTDSE